MVVVVVWSVCVVILLLIKAGTFDECPPAVFSLWSIYSAAGGHLLVLNASSEPL